MTNEHDANREGLPYYAEKIPVAAGVAEFRKFMEGYPGYRFCAYLADKTAAGWAKSTSRQYMNQVLPGMLYVPVNIPQGDEAGLRELFKMAAGDSNVLAVNITMPHKSNAVLREMFLGDRNSVVNVDTLVRGKDGLFHTYDRDAPAFVGWFEADVEPFAGKTVCVMGVGGAGEPIAKLIAASGADRLVLVDPRDKSALAREMSREVRADYIPAMSEVDTDSLPEGVIVINAAGDIGDEPVAGLDAFLDRARDKQGIFVDIRPQLKIPIVGVAEEYGWKAYTGEGMNANNDYGLVGALAEQMGVEPLPFDEFAEFVNKAS